MRSQFPHRLYTLPLFCRRCQRVVEHGVFAREAYSTYGGMNSGIPLLCCCEQCQSVFIAFSQEFSFCSDKTRNGDYAKIYGRNRIAPGAAGLVFGDEHPLDVIQHGGSNLLPLGGYVNA